LVKRKNAALKLSAAFYFSTLLKASSYRLYGWAAVVLPPAPQYNCGATRKYN